MWGEEEVAEVISMIRDHPLALVPQEGTTSDGDWERYLLVRDALVAIQIRLGIDASIDPDQRARLIDILLAYSHAAALSMRRGDAEALCWSGLIFEDPRAETRIHEMMDDPDPRVAANARSRYRFYTQRRDRWAEYLRRRNAVQDKLGGDG